MHVGVDGTTYALVRRWYTVDSFYGRAPPFLTDTFSQALV